jgi:hypothetical protein
MVEAPDLSVPSFRYLLLQRLHATSERGGPRQPLLEVQTSSENKCPGCRDRVGAFPFLIGFNTRAVTQEQFSDHRANEALLAFSAGEKTGH